MLNKITKTMIHLINTNFDIDYNSYSNEVDVKMTRSPYIIEFKVHYTYNLVTYSFATNESPEDGEYEYTPFDITDIILYKDSEGVELTDIEEQEIKNKLLNIIL